MIYWGYRTPGSPGQIFRGLATAIEYLNSDDQVVGTKAEAAKTRVTYNEGSLTVKSGSIFDTTDGFYPPTSTEPNGLPDEPVNIEDGLHNLEHKMHGFDEKPGRGAIFVPFYRSHLESRLIESVDTTANKIILKGTISSNYEQYMLNYGGFAIAYGLAFNLSNQHPNADPSRPVYFFDRTGTYGFAHQDYCEPEFPGVTACTDSTPNGLCQACHLNTNYYLKNGTGTSHYNGSDCMECHLHLFGFKPASTVDHEADPIYLVKSPAVCTDCHSGATMVEDVHQLNCSDCHTSTIPDIRTDYSSYDMTTDNSDCVDCHENGSNLTYQTDFDNLTTGHQVQDHSGLTGNTSATTVTESCFTATYCHAYSSKADIATSIHDACTDCHVNTGSDGRLKVGANDYGDATPHVIYTTSSCDTCHSAAAAFTGFNSHPHPTHDAAHRDGTDQSNGSNCEGCHYDTLPQLDTWNDIYVLHQNSCTLCHNATRDVNPGSPVGITVQDRIGTGSGNKQSPTGCLHCHQDRSTRIEAQPTCLIIRQPAW
jgi:hypothetical protein